jgi:hypothetical protein
MVRISTGISAASTEIIPGLSQAPRPNSVIVPELGSDYFLPDVFQFVIHHPRLNVLKYESRKLPLIELQVKNT